MDRSPCSTQPGSYFSHFDQRAIETCLCLSKCVLSKHRWDPSGMSFVGRPRHLQRNGVVCGRCVCVCVLVGYAIRTDSAYELAPSLLHLAHTL